MQTYSVSEIAAALGTDQVTVRRWIAKETCREHWIPGKAAIGCRSRPRTFLESRPKYARLAANSGLLGRKASMMVGKAAINRVLKIVGDLPAATAVPYLNAEIEKAIQEQEAKEQELATIKENIAALKTLRDVFAHKIDLSSTEEGSK
ncbi:MAG: hypothetical protein ACLSIR_09300 [Christensenellales bacterium]